MSKVKNIRDSYKKYKDESNNPVEIETYVKVVNAFMKFLAKKLLETGEIILPERLGRVFVRGRKSNFTVEDGRIKGLAPDWKKTKELWEKDKEASENKTLVYHFNEETDGIRYKFIWGKERVLVTNKTLYDLRMTRSNKRDLSSRIKSGQEYITLR